MVTATPRWSPAVLVGGHEPAGGEVARQPGV